MLAMVNSPEINLVAAIILAHCALASTAFAQRQMEALGRGLVAIRQDDGRVFVGWRPTPTRSCSRLLDDDCDGAPFSRLDARLDLAAERSLPERGLQPAGSDRLLLV